MKFSKWVSPAVVMNGADEAKMHENRFLAGNIYPNGTYPLYSMVACM